MQKQGLKYVYKCTYVAAVGGLLFGYDTAVVAGAIGFIQTKYGLSPAMMGWVASCALIGCVIGAMFAGGLSDKIGRKKVLMISAFAFAISSLGILLPLGLNYFIFFRLIGGIGIGIASMLSPLYISEIAPANIRGRLISIYQMGIVLGILLIYFVNAGIAGLHNEAWNVNSGWRWMFGSGIIPSILFIILLLNVPESPRWLARQNRLEEAEDVLTKVNGKEKARSELKAITEVINQESGSFAHLLKPGLRFVLIIGIILAILSQVTGINAIMYYAPEIFKSSGDGSSSALMQTVLVGVINVLFTVVAIKYVDKWGRKTLLLIGSAGMTICLGLVGAAFYFNMNQGPLVLLAILAYIAFFAISLGPLTFVVVAEIFPTHVRGRAMSVAIFFLWAAVFLVSQTFPMLQSSVGEASTFWIYMILSVVAFLFVWRLVPETKEKSLEDIEKFWKLKGIES
ncbi:MFS transporter [Paraflavitalea soli]|uniref:MFS transporter n=1 Tax=Paraflavitalea soli TaxID=2315862 RepID=A0A3B7MKW6_9BACT|nr:sugar porter family MFS transporter [Paraflavitalea soli]AXY73933.1 MFS transporter [Paraflavitalea soli]